MTPGMLATVLILFIKIFSLIREIHWLRAQNKRLQEQLLEKTYKK